ncbi:MAG: hypothetical protein LC633_02935, partial [Desulfobulbaceae bacterium]|nr:hypothetical protein [Desulfobulbaceae bacterium]
SGMRLQQQQEMIAWLERGAGVRRMSWAGMKSGTVVCLALFVFAMFFIAPASLSAKNGKIIEGNCENGAGTFEYSSGALYVGEWLNGKEHGRGRMTLPDGSSYEGEYKNGRPHGYGVFQLRDGRQYNGEWKYGVAEGQGVEVNPDGSSYEGHWHNGLPSGYGVSTVGGREEKQGYWVDGEYVGRDKFWNVR